MNDALRQSYDALPYESHAFTQTHPDRLAVVARLFGMHPAPLDECRVLELGCANGANLIPMAAAMPRATFLGIDLSPRQIEAGTARIKELGLTNIELRAADIVDIAQDLSVYDYIIAHGLYSWVPADVQEVVLRICSRNLAPQGVAYVSYNTYPGWGMRGTIRDMMLYHVRQFTDPAVKTGQARAMLDFLAQSVPGETPYAQQLKAELDELRKQPDAYLFHEHLEEYNRPLYFHEFVERADAHGLQYLGESEFVTMLPSNFPKEVAETLARVAPDIIRSEQVMDFLRNRPFRQSLLVHRDVTLNRNVDWSVLETMQIGSGVQPTSVPVDERSSAKAEFKLPNGMSLVTPTPITKAAFVLMGLRWPRSASFADLRDGARARLGTLPTAVPDPQGIAADSRVLGIELMQCVAGGLVELRTRPIAMNLKVLERPVAWAVARQDARTGLHVTNLRHETVTLDEFNRQLLMRLDGTRDRAALAAELAALVANNQLAIQQDGVEVRDPGTVRAIMTRAVDDNLAALARMALFPE